MRLIRRDLARNFTHLYASISVFAIRYGGGNITWDISKSLALIQMTDRLIDAKLIYSNRQQKH